MPDRPTVPDRTSDVSPAARSLAGGALKDLSLPLVSPRAMPEHLRRVHGHQHGIEIGLDEVSGPNHLYEAIDREVLQAEVELGQTLDKRITPDLMLHLRDTAIRANRRFLENVRRRHAGEAPAHKVTFLPTERLIDHVCPNQALPLLFDAVLNHGDGEDLAAAINNGPEDGRTGWHPPETPVELLASMVRYMALADPDKNKFRLRVSDDLRRWIHDTLDEAGIDTKPRPGGNAAWSTCLSASLGHTPQMMLLGDLPRDVAPYFSPDTAVITEDPAVSRLGDVAVSDDFAVNFDAHLSSGLDFLPSTFFPLQVNGELVDSKDLRGLHFLVTGASATKGFPGIDSERMRAIAADQDLVVFGRVQDLHDERSTFEYASRASDVHEAGTPSAVFYCPSSHEDWEVRAIAKLVTRSNLCYIGKSGDDASHLTELVAGSLEKGNPLGLNDELAERIRSASKRFKKSIPVLTGEEREELLLKPGEGPPLLAVVGESIERGNTLGLDKDLALRIRGAYKIRVAEEGEDARAGKSPKPTDELTYQIVKAVVKDAMRGNTLGLDQETIDQAEAAYAKYQHEQDIRTKIKKKGKLIYDTLLAVQEALDLPVVRIRFFNVDTLIIAKGVEIEADDLERVRDNLMASRDLGIAKAAIPTGYFTGEHDLFPIENFHEALEVAVYLALMDAFVESHGDSAPQDILRSSFTEHFFGMTPDGRYVIAHPAKNVKEKKGAKASMGDTKDIGFAAEEAGEGGLLPSALEFRGSREATPAA